jgi:hypothetical protein
MKYSTILTWFAILLIPISVTNAQFDDIGGGQEGQRSKGKDRLFAAAPEFASTHALSPSLVVTGKEGSAKPLERNCLFCFLRIARKDAKKFKVCFNLYCF